MKLILHHLLKDIRAQRWLILLWALVLLVQIIVTALVLQPDYDLAKRVETLRASPFLMLISVIAWTVLLARLIQSEPVTGSTSFWLTRPIPQRVYIPSKLIFILFLITLPSFLPSLLDMIQFQASPEMIRENLEVLLVSQLFSGLCVIWLATFTPSLLHFAGTLCVGFLGLILVSLLMFSLRDHTHNNVAGTVQPVLVHGEILVFGLFASLVVQHWLRTQRTGFILGITTLFIALAGQIFWQASPAPPSQAPAGKFVHVDFSPDWQKTLHWDRGQNNGQDNSQATANLSPMAEDKNAQLIIQSVIAEFQVPGESMMWLPSGDLPNNAFIVRQQQLKPVDLLREKLPGVSIVSTNHDWEPPLPLFSLNPDLKSKLQGKTGRLVLGIHGQMMSLEQQAEIPLNQPHFIARIPEGFIRLRPLDSKENKELVVWKVAWEKNLFFQSQDDTIYVLVDPQNHTGTVLNEGGRSSASNNFGGGSFQLVDSESYLSLKGDEPLDRMVLYIYQITPGDYFESTLTAPNFTMNPTP